MVTGQNTIYRLVTYNTTNHYLAGTAAFGQPNKYIVKAAVRLKTSYCIGIRVIPSDTQAMLTRNTPCIMKYESFHWTGG
jgi:hypothetical protein